MAKNKKKAPPKEYVPEGMSRKDYADAAFKKKVTIIMGSLLLAFFVGIVGILVNAWVKTEQHNKEFEAREQAFLAEKDSVLAQLKNAQTDEEKANVQITLTDENFSDWIAVLDESYQVPKDDESYAQFSGASIRLQGMFVTKEFLDGQIVQYWVQRYHTHDEEDDEHNDHSDHETIPIEVIWNDEDFSIPADNTWVDVSGIVGIDSTNNLSAVRNSVITIMDEPGEAHIQ